MIAKQDPARYPPWFSNDQESRVECGCGRLRKKKLARAFILTRAQEFNSNNYIIHPKDKSIPLDYCWDHDVYIGQDLRKQHKFNDVKTTPMPIKNEEWRMKKKSLYVVLLVFFFVFFLFFNIHNLSFLKRVSHGSFFMNIEGTQVKNVLPWFMSNAYGLRWDPIVYYPLILFGNVLLE